MKNILNNCHIKSKIQQYLGMTPLYFLKITYKYMHKEKKSRKDIYLNTGRSLIWDYPNWSYLCLISKSRCKAETSMQQVFSKHESISAPTPSLLCQDKSVIFWGMGKRSSPASGRDCLKLCFFHVSVASSPIVPIQPTPDPEPDQLCRGTWGTRAPTLLGL